MLAALAAAGEQRLSGVAASIDLSTSRLVSRMARDGLVARGRAAEDRRERRAALTAKGRCEIRAILPTARRYERLALMGFGAGGGRQLNRLLRGVYTNLAGC